MLSIEVFHDDFQTTPTVAIKLQSDSTKMDYIGKVTE